LSTNGKHRPVVLIDGDCGLCQRTQAWVTKRDPAGRYQFHALQSPDGSKWLRSVGLPEDTLDTMVLIEEGRAYLRSTAALRIAKGLKAPWRYLYGFIAVPRPVRDWAYRFVANNRRRFGSATTCGIHTRN
jgi:predicted DCC family thiol-disulfide oxidoreductase YuxK